MVYLYALTNDINAEIYIGISSDLERRLKEHNAGKNRYTKAFKPWKLLYSEQCHDYPSARKREIYFKSTTGRRWLKQYRLKLNTGSLPDC